MTSPKQFGEQVEVMTACGASPQAIARELRIPLATLTSQYKEELDMGLELANAKVAKVFFDLATSGEHPTLTAKWMELRGGWSSSSSLSVTTSEESEVAREKLLRLLNRNPTQAAPSPTPLKAVK